MGGASKQTVIDELKKKAYVLEIEVDRLRTEVQTMAMKMAGYKGRMQVIKQMLELKMEGEE